MPTPLLTTKLYIPPVRPELVSRPRLTEQLNAGPRSGRKLTLVSAPAGFGKTTLLSEWVSQILDTIVPGAEQRGIGDWGVLRKTNLQSPSHLHCHPWGQAQVAALRGLEYPVSNLQESPGCRWTRAIMIQPAFWPILSRPDSSFHRIRSRSTRAISMENSTSTAGRKQVPGPGLGGYCHPPNRLGAYKRHWGYTSKN